MDAHRFAPAVIVAALTLLISAATAHATFPGGNGKIAFSGNGDGDYELFTIDPDGTARTQITHNDIDANLSPLSDTSPAWSPRADKLLFIRRSSIPGLTAIDSVYTANPDGSGEQELFTSIVPDVGWSPAGDRIAYTACTSFGHGSCFGYDALASDADGSNGTFLTRTNDEFELRVDWSPDGSKVAISGFEDIWTVPADGTGVATPLVTGPGINTAPSWSPDGRRLAFMSDRDGNFEIYVAGADGSGQTRLTDNPLDDGNPVWSPDGTKLAFDRRECTPRCVSNILTMDADGTNETPLTSNAPGSDVNDREPDWQSIPGPVRGDFKNRAHFCKAEREFWGEAGFRARHGGGANAHGKCVSGGP